MSKITINNLQTEKTLLVELQSIDAHGIVGGSEKKGKGEGYGEKEGGKKGEGYGEGYGYKGENSEREEHGKGGGYYPPVYHPPVYCPPYH
jgi:hypothetical protein